MADNEPEQPTTKRRLKPAAPSVRQKVEKAQTDADKPSKKRHLRAAGQTAGKPFKKVAKVFDRQPFRFIGRILWPKFARNAFKELQMVTWPTRKETRQLTFAVLVFAALFGAVIAGVDYGLDKLFRTVLLK